MDRSIYIAMNGAEVAAKQQATVAHNLANINTNGYKADFNAMLTSVVDGEAKVKGSRVYTKVINAGYNFNSGNIMRTGKDLDVALKTEGFIAVLDNEGNEGYTRNGSFTMTPEGQLITTAGHPVLGEGGPIAIPPAADRIAINELGEIITYTGEEPPATIAKLKLVQIDAEKLAKTPDGLFTYGDRGFGVPDPNIRVVPGAVETSNVNMITELTNNMLLGRSFEMQIRMMKVTSELSRESARILQVN